MSECEARKILLKLSLDTKGDWEAMFEKIKNKEKVNINPYEFDDARYDYLTLIDDKYPAQLKESNRPPFIIYYKGDINGLLESKHFIGVFNDNLASNYSTTKLLEVLEKLVDTYTFIVRLSTKKDEELISNLLSKGASVVGVLTESIESKMAQNSTVFEKLRKEHLLITTVPETVKKQSKMTQFECAKTIASLAEIIVVGAVAKRSVEMAGIACAIGVCREIYVLPQLAGSNYENNSLIKNGAHLLESAEDILEGNR